ncbi:MAG: patatin-like phospholipase family protein [Bdellovibrionota bacterium]
MANSGEIYGPTQTPASPDYGPDPIHVHPIELVLGPGVARGYAFAGVIRALNEAHIPIGAIFGTEMGSLIGALYAMNGTINHFEWAMLKFKDEIFVENGGLLSRMGEGTRDGQKFEAALQSAFTHKDLSESRLPLRIALQSQDGKPLVLDRGDLVSALRASMAVPGVFTPGTWGGVPAVSANATRPFLIREARELNIGPVVVVNVLNESEVGAAADELKTADLVITPDMSGIQYLDFNKKTDAAFRGKSATQKSIEEIRRLVGLPAGSSGS